MTRATRIKRQLALLTATERAAICLQAFRAGEPEPPAVRDSMPRGQVADFERLARLALRAHNVLTPMMWLIPVQVENAGLRSLLVLHAEADERDQVAAAAWDSLCQVWDAVLAWEQLADEAVAAFGHEAVLPEGLRGFLGNARETLGAIQEGLEPFVGQRPLPEVDLDQVDILRSVLWPEGDGT